MNIKEKLIKLFNQYKVEANEETLDIAKHFTFKFSKGQWLPVTRMVMNEKMSALFQRFLKQYNKHYRVDVAAKEFYQLTDAEIEDMFDELPYYLKTFQGKEMYKPNAANFLKEKIWTQDYPNKPKRDRSRKISITDFGSWEDYISSLPENSRDAAAAYSDFMSFESFKQMVNGN